MQHCATFLLQTPARSGVVTKGSQWPWCFLQYDHDAGNGAFQDSMYADISMTLDMGLVLGSDEFCRDVALSEGIRTAPGVRGRPRKDVQA